MLSKNKNNILLFACIIFLNCHIKIKKSNKNLIFYLAYNEIAVILNCSVRKAKKKKKIMLDYLKIK